MTPDIDIESGTIVLATAQITAALAEKTTVDDTAVFADAQTRESAERQLKEYLEEQFLTSGILAEVTVSVGGVSEDPAAFDDEDEDPEDGSYDAEFSTDSDPEDEDTCCGNVGKATECLVCPDTDLPSPFIGGCPEEEDDDSAYITLKLTPAEAAAVRVLVGRVGGSGALRQASHEVYIALCGLLSSPGPGFTNDILVACLESADNVLEPTSEAAFLKVVSAYKQVLKGQPEPEEEPRKFTYSQAYEPQRRVF